MRWATCFSTCDFFIYNSNDDEHDFANSNNLPKIIRTYHFGERFSKDVRQGWQSLKQQNKKITVHFFQERLVCLDTKILPEALKMISENLVSILKKFYLLDQQRKKYWTKICNAYKKLKSSKSLTGKIFTDSNYRKSTYVFHQFIFKQKWTGVDKSIQNFVQNT